MWRSKAPLRDEVGEGLLLEEGAAAVGEELRARERLHERARQHQVPDAERGKHDLESVPT